MMTCTTDSHSGQGTDFVDALDHMKQLSHKISRIRMSSDFSAATLKEDAEEFFSKTPQAPS